MDRLPAFLDAAQARGASFVQEFPPDCVPVVRGRVVAPMQDYVA